MAYAMLKSALSAKNFSDRPSFVSKIFDSAHLNILPCHRKFSKSKNKCPDANL